MSGKTSPKAQDFDFAAISEACVKCGKCRPDCTIYKVSGDETRSPRGFLDLIGAYQRGELVLDKAAKKTFESCFLCTTCVSQCPSRLPVDEMIEHVRAEAAKKFGITWYKRAFFWLTKHRFILDLLARVGYFFVPCAFKVKAEPSVAACGGGAAGASLANVGGAAGAAQNGAKNAAQNGADNGANSNLTAGASNGASGVSSSANLNKNKTYAFESKEMNIRVSIPFILPKERTLPSVAKRSFLNSHPEFIDNGGERTVGLFIGCMANYAYTNVGEALLKICRELKINVNLMKKQLCCGSPAYFTGDLATTRDLARKNIAYFEQILRDCEVIIVPEATCSAMLNTDYPKILAGDAAWAARADAVCARVVMASEFFAKKTNLREVLAARRAARVAADSGAGAGAGVDYVDCVDGVNGADGVAQNIGANGATNSNLNVNSPQNIGENAGENGANSNLSANAAQNPAQIHSQNPAQTPAQPPRLRVTYHDACHAKKVQNLYKEPRELLGEVCEICEAGDLSSCCGFGGVTMQSQNYELSREVGVARARQLGAVGAAQVVAAECSACRMQLNNALGLIGSDLRVKNTIELIAEGLD